MRRQRITAVYLTSFTIYSFSLLLFFIRIHRNTQPDTYGFNTDNGTIYERSIRQDSTHSLTNDTQFNSFFCHSMTKIAHSSSFDYVAIGVKQKSIKKREKETQIKKR